MARTLTVSISIVVVLSLAAGCTTGNGSTARPGANASAVSSADQTDATDAPPSETTDEPTDETGSESTPTPRRGDFSQPTETTFADRSAFSSVSFFRAAGLRRGVTVTVIGTNPDTVAAFTAEAAFAFRVEAAESRGGETEGSDGDTPEEDVPGEFGPQDLLADPASQNLYVEFALTDAAADVTESGLLHVWMDPTIPNGAYHNFYMKDPGSAAGDTVRVSQTMRTGEASAYLFLNCVYKAYMRVTPATSPREIRSSGAGKFDFMVVGRGSPSSTYQLSGSWYFEYATTIPSETSARITC